MARHHRQHYSQQKGAVAREYENIPLQPHHAFCCEVTMEATFVFAAILFIIGSICFFSFQPVLVLEVGEILFMVASSFYLLIGIIEIIQMCQESSDGVLSNTAFHEQMAYLLSAVIFTTGTVLYWPNLFQDPGVAKNAEQVACWCFVIGSLGFVIAGFWNAVSLHPVDEEHGEGQCWHRLTKSALFFSLLGGVFFVTGSYLYTLDVEEGCNPDEGKKSQSTLCIGVADQGTWLFVLGSFFYLIQAILNATKLCVRQCLLPDGYCAVDDDDYSNPNTDSMRSMYYEDFEE